MTMRIFLAGLLGGVAMFIWSSIAHIALPLGRIGVRELPNEPAVLSTLQSNIGDQAGLFIYPGSGLPPDATGEQRKEAMKQMGEKIATNPSGIIAYHPPGRKVTMGKQLGVEFVTELIESILAVFLLAQTRIVAFVGRVGFMAVAGILAAIATNVSYWDWYGFPRRYVAAYMLTQVIGFICAGIVAALILPRTATAQA